MLLSVMGWLNRYMVGGPQVFVTGVLRWMHVEQVDLMDKAAIEAAVSSLEGQVDVLCNIAGVPPTAPVATVLTVNFVALRYFTELMLDKLKDGGVIVNMASLAGLGWPEAVEDVKRFIAEADFDNVSSLCAELNVDAERSYFFSKEVVIVWTMQTWPSLKSRGIRINSVSPGPVETPILKDFLETLGERAEEDMKIQGPGTPENIANVTVFMCSDDSTWINGANIPVDGGMYAHVMSQIHGFAASTGDSE